MYRWIAILVLMLILALAGWRLHVVTGERDEAERIAMNNSEELIKQQFQNRRTVEGMGRLRRKYEALNTAHLNTLEACAMNRMALLLMCCAALLPACVPLLKVQERKLHCPLEMLECPDKPARPADIRLQSEAAVYLKELELWGDKCKAANDECRRFTIETTK